MIDFIKEFWGFLKERKKWWLAPILILVVLIGIILLLGASSALAPFVYSLF